MDGISNTVFGKSSLRELEEEGLVVRKEYLEVPVRVEYSTTAMGERLMPILERVSATGAWINMQKQREIASWKPRIGNSKLKTASSKQFAPALMTGKQTQMKDRKPNNFTAWIDDERKWQKKG